MNKNLLAFITFLSDNLSEKQIAALAQQLDGKMQNIVNNMTYDELRALKQDLLEKQDFEALKVLDAQIKTRFEL
jgi:arsenate reductase-like glutaredoxin family protein